MPGGREQNSSIRYGNAFVSACQCASFSDPLTTPASPGRSQCAESAGRVHRASRPSVRSCGLALAGLWTSFASLHIGCKFITFRANYVLNLAHSWIALQVFVSCARLLLRLTLMFCDTSLPWPAQRSGGWRGRLAALSMVSCPSRPPLRRQPHHFRHGRAHNRLGGRCAPCYRRVRWHRCRRSQDYAPRLIVCTVHKLVK